MAETILVQIHLKSSVLVRHQLGGVPAIVNIAQLKLILFAKIPELISKPPDSFTYKINDSPLYSVHDSQTLEQIRRRRGIAGNIVLELFAIGETPPENSNDNAAIPSDDTNNNSNSNSNTPPSTKKSPTSMPTPPSIHHNIPETMLTPRTLKSYIPPPALPPSKKKRPAAQRMDDIGGSLIVQGSRSFDPQEKESHSAIAGTVFSSHTAIPSLTSDDNVGRSLSPRGEKKLSNSQERRGGGGGGEGLPAASDGGEGDSINNGGTVSDKERKEWEKRMRELMEKESKVRQVAMAIVEKRRLLQAKESEIKKKEKKH